MSLLKKLMSFMLSALLLVTSFSFAVMPTATADSGNTPALCMANTNGKPGEMVDVPIFISDNPGITGIEINIKFTDPLKLVAVKAGNVFKESEITLSGNYSKAPYKILCDTTQSNHNDGIIATLSFEIPEGSEIDTHCEIKIGCKAGTETGPVTFALGNGSVFIIDFKPGDVNNDGDVDVFDLVPLRRFIVGGYGVTINERAADVNDDKDIDIFDVLKIRKYIVDGKELLPSTPIIKHTMEKVPGVEPTCTEPGSREYWHCTVCGKDFEDEKGEKEIIDPEQKVIPAPGHTIEIIPAVPATATTSGWSECQKCSVCGEILVPSVEIAPLGTGEYSVDYRVGDDDSHLKNAFLELKNKPESPYKDRYNKNVGMELKDLNIPGYKFLGWYENPDYSGAIVKKIQPGETGNKTYYAKMQANVYHIQYNVFDTPVEEITDQNKTQYTVSNIPSLPNPELKNYVFLGWFTDDGVRVRQLNDIIDRDNPKDIKLNAYCTSHRFLAIANPNLGDPIILEDQKYGIIYFTYELGKIINVPIAEIWRVNSLNGIAEQRSVETTWSTEEANQKEFTAEILKSTVNSGIWSLSKGWQDIVTADETWAAEHGMTVEEATERSRTDTGSTSLTHYDGPRETTATESGETALEYGSTVKTDGTDTTNKWHVEGQVGADIKVVDVNVSGGGGQDKLTRDMTDTHSGTDTTKHGKKLTTSETIPDATITNSGHSSTNVERKSKMLSEIIAEEKHYGTSYAYGVTEGTEFGITEGKTIGLNETSAVAFKNSESKIVTRTYSTDGRSEGYYRLVMAGTAHVFGVIGYNIAEKTYFTESFSVMDDKVEQFLDYSTKSTFDDCQNGVLPFDIPYFVYEFVNGRIAQTKGLIYETDDKNNTAVVTGYTGEAVDVLVPEYCSIDGTYYRVVGLTKDAFANNKKIESVILSNMIKTIPKDGFRGCSSLKEAAGCFEVIEDHAFGGCSNLNEFELSKRVTEIGKDAFAGVRRIKVNVSTENSQEIINKALASGADEVVINIENVPETTALTFDVPELNYFELQGGNVKTRRQNLKVISHADTTVLDNLGIVNNAAVPLDIYSENLSLEVVDVSARSYSALLHADNPKITLTKTSRFTSSEGKAVVWKNPVLISKNLEGAIGKLNVSGNVYFCGEIQGKENMRVENGYIIEISDEEFGKYIKGMVTVNFNANGGTVTPAYKTVSVGDTLGECPTPVRDKYSFSGWFDSAGNRITESSVMSGDVTLIAHWTMNPVNVVFDANGGKISERSRAVEVGKPIGSLPTPAKSGFSFEGWFNDAGNKMTGNETYTEPKTVTLRAHWKSGWVKAGEAPAGAQIVNAKWTYTKTTKFESKKTSEPGCSQVSFRWNKTGSGSKNYATFPNGFDTSHNIYTSFAKSNPYSASETATTKREVSTKWGGYVYWHWMYDTNKASGSPKRAIYYKKGTGPDNGFGYKYFGAFTSTKGNYSGDKLYCNSQNMYNYIIPERTAYADCQGATRWFRFEFQTSSYTDYEKIFTYQKVENNLESTTEMTNGGDISNVQKWVTYRIK